MSDRNADSHTNIVRVQLFAGAKQAAGGREQLTLELPQRADAAKVLQAIAAQVPELAALTRVSRLAVEDQYVAADTPIHAGMTLMLIPPVSGG